jgi:hypothetical protein
VRTYNYSFKRKMLRRLLLAKSVSKSRHFSEVWDGLGGA